jgi:HJR/Mrr/RecB family endonuclease
MTISSAPEQPTHARDTCTTLLQQIQRLDAECRSLETDIREREACLLHLWLAESWLQLQRAVYTSIALARTGLTALFGWKLASIVILGSAAGAACFISTSSWIFGLLGAVSSAISATWLMYWRSDDALTERIDILQREREKLEAQRSGITRALRPLQAQLGKLDAERQEKCLQLAEAEQAERRRLWQESADNRRRQLPDFRWDMLGGADFENFLNVVFRELGYKVWMTGQTGDNGADLIVSKGGYRLAVQAKGWPSKGHVGKDAVQAVHFAQDYYKCDGAVIITNSRFTRSARKAALRVGCVLIDRGKLRNLILGEVDLCEMHRRAAGLRRWASFLL